MVKKIILSTLFVTLFFAGALFSQQSISNTGKEAEFQSALDLFQKQKYGASLQAFKALGESIQHKESVMAADIAFYQAASACYLGNNGADKLLEHFITDYQTSIFINEANLMAGNFRFERRSYKRAAKFYAKVDDNNLSPEQFAQLSFRYGYSLFYAGDNQAAKNLFDLVRNGDSEYASSAKYYYGYIAYLENDYTIAKQIFESLQYDPKYANSIPFFLLNIYLMEGNYAEVVRIGPGLYDIAAKDQRPEVAKLVAAAAFQKANYDMTKRYLDYYLKESRYSTDRGIKYQLAYCAYKNREYPEAIEWFEKVTTKKDSITQSAYYHIGDCYLLAGEKKKAQHSFYSAYQMDSDLKIKEDALFNYAKLTYELSYDPYNEAFKALDSYLQKYPNSPRSDEARQYLINLAMSTKNYSAALKAFEKIKNKNSELQGAEQKITFLKGIELFENKKYEDAISWFAKSSKFNRAPTIKAQSVYWMAESYYRLGKYQEANEFFRRFLWTTDAEEIEEFPLAYYNLGYVSFKQQKYSEAKGRFQKFLNLYSNGNPELSRDAYLRLGDCAYLSRDYSAAITNYDKVIFNRNTDADYALFQKAMSLGAQNNLLEKTNILQNLVADYPKSPYADDAYFELGLTYLILNDNNSALNQFETLINQYPQSNLKTKSLLRNGLILFNIGRSNESLAVLKNIVKDFPHTSQAKEALSTIKAIYLDMNRVDDYFAYVEDVPFANITTGSQDSLSFIAAENKYLEEDILNATIGFKSYVEKYPNGFFALSAHNYLANCYENSLLPKKALEQYEILLEAPQNQYVENSALRAATMVFEKGEYQKAANYFKRLEACSDNKANIVYARNGLLQVYQKEEKYDSVIIVGYNLLATEKVPEEVISEAHFAIANAAYKVGNFALANREFSIVVGLENGENAAASAWHLAEILYANKKYEESMQAAFDLINNYPSYEYWLVKSYILLADNYSELENYFQAGQTLQSVVDNCDIEDLKAIAVEKLAIVRAEEAKIEAAKEKERDSIQVMERAVDTIN